MEDQRTRIAGQLLEGLRSHNLWATNTVAQLRMAGGSLDPDATSFAAKVMNDTARTVLGNFALMNFIEMVMSHVEPARQDEVRKALYDELGLGQPPI